MLGQEHGGEHAQAVVHPAGLHQLAHGGVHQRVAGAAFAPGLEVLFVIAPLQQRGLRPERRAGGQRRKAVHDLPVEIPPGQLTDPGGRALPGLGVLQRRPRRQVGVQRRQRARRQRRGQAAGAGLGGKVPPRFVVAQMLLDKILQLAARGVLAGVPQGGHRVRHGQRLQRPLHPITADKAALPAGPVRRRHRLGLKVVHPHVPALLIGGKDGIGRALAGVQRPRRHQHAVVETVDAHALRFQAARHRPVPVQFVERVLPVAEHLGDALLGHEVFQRGDAAVEIAAVEHMQIHAPRRQGLAQLQQAVQHKPATRRRHAVGVPLVRAQNVQRCDRVAAGQRLGQRGVPVTAQIISKPDQSHPVLLAVE